MYGAKLNLFDCPVTGRQRARTFVPWEFRTHYKSSSIIHGRYNSETRSEIESRHRRLIDEFEAIRNGQIAFSDVQQMGEIIDQELFLHTCPRTGRQLARTYVPSDLRMHYKSDSVFHGYNNIETQVQIYARHNHLIREFQAIRDGQTDAPADLEHLEIVVREGRLEQVKEEEQGEEEPISVVKRRSDSPIHVDFGWRSSWPRPVINREGLLGLAGYAVGKQGLSTTTRRDCIKAAMTIIVEGDNLPYGSPNSIVRQRHLIGVMKHLLGAARTKEKRYGHDMSAAIVMWEDDIKWLSRLPTSSYF